VLRSEHRTGMAGSRRMPPKTCACHSNRCESANRRSDFDAVDVVEQGIERLLNLDHVARLAGILERVGNWCQAMKAVSTPCSFKPVRFALETFYVPSRVGLPETWNSLAKGGFKHLEEISKVGIVGEFRTDPRGGGVSF
jgi:hypothetical protein